MTDFIHYTSKKLKLPLKSLLFLLLVILGLEEVNCNITILDLGHGNSGAIRRTPKINNIEPISLAIVVERNGCPPYQ